MKTLILFILLVLLINAIGCGNQPQPNLRVVASPISPIETLPESPTPNPLVGTWVATDYVDTWTFTETNGSNTRCGWQFSWANGTTNQLNLTNLTTVDQDYPCDPAFPSNMHYQSKVCSVTFLDQNHIQMTCLYDGQHYYTRN